nr:cytochrome b/b6 domain-containing protein [Rappaport israeli]
MLTMLITGYLLATAKGNSINFFDLFTLPALIDSDAYARTLGKIHLYSAWALILFAVLHALGALKHTLIDRDKTLKRML